MNTVKFISQDSRAREFGLELRKRVSAYFKERNLSVKGGSLMVFKAISMLTLYLLPFVMIFILPSSWLTIILLSLVMGTGAAGVGMAVMHDAAHGAFSEKKWVNSLFSSTMYLLGSTVFNWKIQHNMLHHTYTNIYGYDPDIDTKALLRLSEHSPLRRFHRFQYLYAYFFYGLMTISKLLMVDIAQLIEYNRSGLTKEQNCNPAAEMFKLIEVKCIYLFVIIGLPLLLTDYSFAQIITGFIIMQVTAGGIMSTTFQMAHVVEGTEQPLPDENGVINCDWLQHEIRTTADFARGNLFLNWYIGGLNFQIEHHLFPGTCHMHYRKIAPIVEKTANEFGIKYNLKPTAISAFLSHASRLKTLGAK